MKAFLRISLLFVTVFSMAVTASFAQRVIKGTVYMNGELGAGITVEAHKGGSMMTGFDGKYEVEASEKTKYLRFTFIDDQKKLDIEGKPGDTFDFAFSGEMPSAAGGEESSGGVVLKSVDELLKEQNKDFMQEFTMYREFYKQEDYKSAWPHLEKLYAVYPKSTLANYQQGAKIKESFINNAKTDAERDKQLDGLMKIYDDRIKYFNQKGYVLGRKGTSWLKYKLDPNRTTALEGENLTVVLKSGYGWLMESMEEQGNETELPVLVLIMQTTRSLYKLDEIAKETVVENFQKCNAIVNYVIENEQDDSRLENASTVQAYIEDIFGKSGAADCDAIIKIFTPQFKANGDDADFVKNMLRRLRKTGCEDSPLAEKATVRLYELDPSAEAAFNMAHRYLKRDEFEKAKEYYQQAMDQETDQDLLATYYYQYALFIYAKESALSEARSYARKALAINSDLCEANMLIGDIYLAASRNFEGTDLEKSAVFWVAVDYFNKARRSEDCSIDAAKKANDYKKYFPKKEEAFMEGLHEGATYKVEGWINETTKVRF